MKTKKINMYYSDDGWVKSEKQSDIKKYEAFIKFAQKLLADIPYAKDKKCQFANGDGFIQHDKAKIKKARVALMKRYPNCAEREGNYLQLDLWCRLNWRIDHNYREWGQEYYADHNNLDAKEWPYKGYGYHRYQ